MRRYEVVTHNAKHRTGWIPQNSFVKCRLEALGRWYKLVDHDGTMEGYDIPMIERLRAEINLPMTALGGAGSYADIADLWCTQGLIGAGVGVYLCLRKIPRCAYKLSESTGKSSAT